MEGETFVSVTAWIAVAFWFAGALIRNRAGANIARRQTGYAWLIGAITISIHICASYAIVHHWSHTDAIRVTAEESERVTGIRAGWGVYVNFVFAAAWLGYALVLIRNRSLPALVDQFLFWSTGLIVFSATVIFESGLPRIISLVGFTAVISTSLWGYLRSTNHGNIDG